ncbi:MAG: disulfide oxidoreductase, partial [Pseudomonadota bacterium]
AIRIDMLERLADMLRVENSRAGFEANADMLSITGMTLDQFADLMGGLGYKADRGEREKVKAALEPSEDAEASPESCSASDEPVSNADQTKHEAAVDSQEESKSEEPETEVFYTFTWGGNRGARAANDGHRQRPGSKPKGRKPQKGKGKPRRDDKAKVFSAKPKKTKEIDPDNPFAAALMGLKDK